MCVNLNLLKGLIYSKYGSQLAVTNFLEWDKNKIGKILRRKMKPSIDNCYPIYKALSLSKEECMNIFTPFLTPNGDVIVNRSGTKEPNF